MPLDFQRARPLLRAGNLPKLFVEELGWEPHRQKLTLRAGERDFTFTAIAEKRGFVAWLCECADGKLPDHGTRLKLDRELTQTSFEHVVVFITGDRARQSWMWVRREPGRPVSARTHEYLAGQPGDSLLQKLQFLAVSIEEEEEGISITDVAGRARAAFDVERVTKKFFEEFRKQHAAFLQFISGIPNQGDHEWYASVMLNRLMFLYFIQRKGFLDGDENYLRNRLQTLKAERGKDKFYSFYRYFLLKLFHGGLNARRKDRQPELEKLLGRVPYLNGGIFDVHQLEGSKKDGGYGDDIQIPDQAFEAIFDYFDRYQWSLDERPLRADNEINPDVLGYIFEKYINQKQMGAYYTKEDITGYIGQNTILPFLFDKVAQTSSLRSGPGAEALGKIWQLLRDDPDRYLYPAVRHGLSWDYQPGHPEQGVALERDRPLPTDIAAGLDTTKPDLLERRKPWNKPAPATHGLPTEIWRETIARRQRCAEVRKKLAAGEVRDIADFITLNLDLRRFALDVIQRCESPELLRAFWHALTRVTILDPTCGSGAFLFAALNILEPLYKACLDRMDAMLCDAFAEVEPGKRRLSPKGHPDLPHKKLGDFTEILDHVAEHPNERYFIFKSIILHNLYGVDLMEEAVEICKLRLFLKLAAQVEPDAADANLGIEPLPDIDFNIRAGNTLVGYATRAELEAVGRADLLLKEEVKKVLEAAEDAAAAYDTFVRSQLDGENPAEFKRRLNEKFSHAREQCDRFLAESYFGEMPKAKKFAEWKRSHQPFHWFVEFFGILNAGGFDVVIGNPPYVELKKVVGTYRLPKDQYSSEDAANLYAFCMERSAKMLRPNGCFGMIVPTSLVGLNETECLRKFLLLRFNLNWLSTYAIRPSKLFDGVDQRLCIHIATRVGSRAEALIYTSGYQHWNADERDFLFSRIGYTASFNHPRLRRIPQVGDRRAASVLLKLERKMPKSADHYYSRTSHGLLMHYHRSPRYWIRGMDFEQYFKSPTSDRSVHHFRDIYIADKDVGKFIGGLINSTLFFFWFLAVGNGRNVTGADIEKFPVGDVAATHLADAEDAFDRLMKDYDRNSIIRKRSDCEFQEFRPSLSKPILDEIDAVLAGHYGFTEEELDFIVNYDIKYRLGRDTETDEE